MTKELIEQLISISNRKLNLLNDMLKYTEEQKNAIDKEDIENIDLIINKKDKLIEEIDSLDLQFLTKFSQIKKENNIENIDELDIREYPNLKELKNVVKEISSTLMALFLLDKENNALMKKGLENVKSNLSKVKKGQKAYKGYTKTVNNSILIDEKK